MTARGVPVLRRIDEGDTLYIRPNLGGDYMAKVVAVNLASQCIEITHDVPDVRGVVTRRRKTLHADTLATLDAQGGLIINPDRPAYDHSRDL